MTAPVFIEVKNYRQVLDRVDTIKVRVAEIHKLVQEVERLRAEEQEHLSAAQAQIDKMRSAITRVEEEV